MTGDPIQELQARDYLLQPMTEEECKQLFANEVQKLKQQMEEDMKKDKQSESGVNRHKRMAMGESIELKKGGVAKKEKPKSKKK